MYINDETYYIKVLITKRNKKILKDYELYKECIVHWSFLKKSSKRRHKINIKCDDCGEVIKNDYVI